MISGTPDKNNKMWNADKQKPEKQKLIFSTRYILQNLQKIKHFKEELLKGSKEQKRTELFIENIIQIYPSFAFKTVKMRWGLIADEDQSEKHQAYKLYFYFSGLNLNIFLVYYSLHRKGRYFSFKTETEKKDNSRHFLREERSWFIKIATQQNICLICIIKNTEKFVSVIIIVGNQIQFNKKSLVFHMVGATNFLMK